MDIQLEKVNHEDLELIRNWRNSDDVAKYMYTSDIITVEMQQKWFEKINKDQTSIYWLILYKDKSIGLASVTQISPIFDSCNWAFYIGDTSVRGAGIGSKTEYNVLKYVFETLGLNKLKCEVFSFNDKVISMHEKFGFRREAYYRKHVKKDGKYHDVVGLAILRYEWEQIKDRMYQKIYNR